MQQVKVRVPASTSNLGPGFDCLGVALRIYNQVALRRGKYASRDKMVVETARKFFAITGRRFNFSCAITGNIPVARGLGSSVTIRLGVLHGLNELSGAGLTRHDLFRLCTELEGHPDNAAPASFGGFTVARPLGLQRFPVSPRLYFVLLVPDFEVETYRARRLLPASIPHDAAISSAANAAAIAAAFASQRYRMLRGHFADGLHQPYRKKLVPFLDQVIAAAEAAGALGGFLSGSGSSICALTLDHPDKIAKAMVLAADDTNAMTIITRGDNRGVRLLR